MSKTMQLANEQTILFVFEHLILWYYHQTIKISAFYLKYIIIYYICVINQTKTIHVQLTKFDYFQIGSINTYS